MALLSTERKWMILSGAAALAGSALTDVLLSGAWKRGTGRRPPENPASPHVSWREALAWALITGATTSLAGMLAERGAAEGWRRRTGRLPRALRRRA